MIRLLMAISLLLLLSGCPPTPVTLKTVTLSPSGMWGSYEYWHVWCELSSLGTFGVAPPPLPSRQINSGYYDIYYDAGGGPFACPEEWNFLLRSEVAFDLSRFDQIVNATLNFGLESSTSAPLGPDDSGTIQDNPPQSYASTLGMSTGPTEWGGNIYWDFDNPVPFPRCSQMMFEPCSIDVTSQTKAWINHSHTNFGFIIAGPILDFPSNISYDNGQNISWYGHFQLQVLYNPALNPRAPQ